MRISDWSSDVCSSDLAVQGTAFPLAWRQDRAPLDHERSRRARRRSRCESGAFHRRYGRDQAADAQPAAAVHDLDAATGGGTTARLLLQPNHAACTGHHKKSERASGEDAMDSTMRI